MNGDMKGLDNSDMAIKDMVCVAATTLNIVRWAIRTRGIEKAIEEINEVTRVDNAITEGVWCGLLASTDFFYKAREERNETDNRSYGK